MVTPQCGEIKICVKGLEDTSEEALLVPIPLPSSSDSQASPTTEHHLRWGTITGFLHTILCNDLSVMGICTSSLYMM